MTKWLLSSVACLLLCAALAPAAQAAGTGAISGKVTEGGGLGVPNIDVCALVASNGEIGGCTRTEGGGVYTIGSLTAGSYKVEFFPERASGYLREYWNNKRSLAAAEEVTVTEGATTPNIDAKLELAPKIKGTVTDAVSSEPIQGIVVCALEAGTEVDDRCTQTDAAGNYTLDHLQFESDVVEFWAPNELNYVTQFWHEKSSFAAAEPIALAPEETVEGKDAKLSHGGFIEGHITEAGTGTPLAGIWACAFSAAGKEDRCVQSGTGGSYALTGQATGLHKVGFSLEEGEADAYLEQYWADKSSLAAADPISVGAPFTTTAGIDVGLVNMYTRGGSTTTTTAPPVIVVQPEAHKPFTCPKKKRKKVVKGKPRCVPKKHKKHHKHRRHHRHG